MSIHAHLETIDRVIQAGPYTGTWESIAGHKPPSWYTDAKIGMFIHWGLYSVPAYYTEWYPRLMYYKGNPVYRHHLKKYGKDFNYRDFIPRFTAERFDPRLWIEKARNMGARFVMPVAEHHDGFKMYASELSRWNAAEMGPRRDILGELRAACGEAGLGFAASSHRAEHYWFMNGGRTLGRPTEVTDEQYRDFYGPVVNVEKNNNLLTMLKGQAGIEPPQEWLEDWLASSCEVVDKYRPAAFYFDFWTSHPAFRPYLRKFIAYYLNRAAERGQEVCVFHKMDAAPYGCEVFVKERGQLAGISPLIWQCETSTAYNAWSYCTTNKYKGAEEIACNMADVWSKNGCFALNIGPKGDGSLCDEELAVLDKLAAWTSRNAEAIWGTRPWRVFGEGRKQKAASFAEKYRYTGADFRFTCRLGALYIFALVPQGRRVFAVRSLRRDWGFAAGTSFNCTVKRVTLLGGGVPAAFKQKAGYMELRVPQPLTDTMPVCFKLEIE